MNHAERFAAMRSALHAHGQTQPVIVVDQPQLLANIDRVASDLPTGMAVRLVAKSLPSVELLELCSERLNTQRFMTFNLPMLQAIAAQFPQADQMLGKPFPVAAARSFLQSDLGPRSTVHWLIDTTQRLQQFMALADELSMPLNIALELDVGLHRGGFEPDGQLTEALRVIKQSSRLILTAMVGYEAHVSKVPTALGWRERQFQAGLAIYSEALARVGEVLSESSKAALICNAGGSPTFRMYGNAAVANEVALGSVLVKPGDFDTDTLGTFVPAAFIATPALKVLRPVRTPVLEAFDAPRRLAGRRNAVCIHGGYWKADPVDPPGLAYDSSFGRSSNQEVLVTGDDVDLEPDDFVFLRPTQSEVVLGQLGDLAVFDGENISARWSVFPPAG